MNKKEIGISQTAMKKSAVNGTLFVIALLIMALSIWGPIMRLPYIPPLMCWSPETMWQCGR